MQYLREAVGAVRALVYGCSLGPQPGESPPVQGVLGQKGEVKEPGAATDSQEGQKVGIVSGKDRRKLIYDDIVTDTEAAIMFNGG